MRTGDNAPLPAAPGWGAVEGWRDPRRFADWARRFPWLAQGSTGRGPNLRTYGVASEGQDGSAPSERESSAIRSARRAWRRLGEIEGFEHIVLTRQVHGDGILVHGSDRLPGADPRIHHPAPLEADGHITAEPGVLLAVTVADCVPVFMVDPAHRSIAVLHAGWRSAAAGILQRGLGALSRTFGTRPEDVFVHLGPAICGSCYEVGPEVHRALGLPVPTVPTPVDVGSVLRQRALDEGVRPDRITRDTSCTLAAAELYSHRGGDTGRQVGFLGIRSGAGPSDGGR